MTDIGSELSSDLAAARTALGEAVFTALWQEGCALTTEQTSYFLSGK